MNVEAIFIGTSAGGVTALQKLFLNLPAEFKIPIVITQHLPSNAEIDLNLVFRMKGQIKPIEALDKMNVESSHIYFAPPNYHLLIEKDLTLSLSQEEPVHFSRPSIDILFESAAKSLGERACGILMTGANEDGALGLKFIKECGGYTIVQNPADAEIPVMPQSALNLFNPDFVGNLHDIAAKLASF